MQLIDPSCQVINTNMYNTSQGNKVLRAKSDTVTSYEL